MSKIPIRHIVQPASEPHLPGTFSIRSLEVVLSGEDMVQELHRHNFFYVLVLERGKGEHTIDFVPYAVSDYSVFFMRPGQVHQLVLKNESKGFLMEFTPEFYAPHRNAANQVLRSVSNKVFCPVADDRFRRLQDILSRILEEYGAKRARYQDVIRSSLDIFFIELLRQSRDPQRASNGSSEYQQERLEALQELIALHAPEHKEVAYYADELRLTPYQLNAITKATLGKTCSEMINDHVILEARRSLLATSDQVNQIAWQLGYEDVSYFIRFFKKHTGSSPDAFRRNFK